MGKKISNIALPFIVLLLGVIILGMIGIGEDDVSRNYLDADSITLRNTGNYNIGPSGEGVFLQNPPFIYTGGTTPPGMNNQAGNSNQQQRIPGEGSWMGMEIEGLSPGTIAELNLPKNQKGVILDSVPAGSDAEKAGLQNGDIVRAINGQIIVNMADYIRATKNQKMTSGVIELERNGQIVTVTLPANQAFSQSPAISQQQAYSTQQGFQQQQTYSPQQQQWVQQQQPVQQQPSYSPQLQPYAQQQYPYQWNQYSQQSGVQAGLPAPNIDTLTSASPKFTRIINPTQIPPITMNSPLPHPYVGVCMRCHEIVQGRVPLNLLNSPMSTQGVVQGNSSLPSPAQQNAAHKVLVEGHWLGMELIPITPELAQEYRLPAGVTGLLVDEVTLEAAESGLLAGDVLQSINNIPISNLEEFELATRKVESLPEVILGALRNGQVVYLTLRSSWTKLGVAQNEAAQPILPGALSPHKDMGRACTDCHIIMKNGGQLQTDAGDILPVPPPIRTNATAPHSYRGQCNRCHTIIK